MTRLISSIVTTILCLSAFGCSLATAHESSLSDTDFPARPSGVTFVTTDLEASIQFYESYLGYSLRARRTIDNPAGLSPFGLAAGGSFEYANLVPGEYSEELRNFVHLNFAEIKSTRGSAYPDDSQRAPIASETVMAFSVTHLKETAQRMTDSNVPVVVPLALSASGRSLAITVLDPNGVRVQLYEFLGK